MVGELYTDTENLTEQTAGAENPTEAEEIAVVTAENPTETEEIAEVNGILTDGENLPVTDDSEPSVKGENEPSEPPTAEEEIEALTAEHPEIVEAMESINMKRYTALRSIGLTPEEAYLAASRPKRGVVGTSHLSDSMPRSKKSSETGIPPSELCEARRIFEGMSDSELHKLYKKVTR